MAAEAFFLFYCLHCVVCARVLRWFCGSYRTRTLDSHPTLSLQMLSALYAHTTGSTVIKFGTVTRVGEGRVVSG